MSKQAIVHDQDKWRIRPLGNDVYAFGPIHLTMPLPEKAAAYLCHIAATPGHSMHWGDMAALEFVPLPAPIAVSKINRTIQTAYHKALRARFGEQAELGLPMVVSAQRGMWKDKPLAIIQSAPCILNVFVNALNTGLTADERQRLSKLTCKPCLARDIKSLPPMWMDWRSNGSSSITYAGARSCDAHWGILQDFVSCMGGDACVWPAMKASKPGGRDFDANLQITHFPWLKAHKGSSYV